MRYLVCPIVLVTIAIATCVVAQDTPKSYPITLNADDVHIIADFSVESNGLSLTGEDIAILPIRCDAGITGAMVIGNGTYSYAAADDSNSQSGKFRAAMLRFHPDDQPSLLPLSESNATTDLAVHEMARHMLDNVFRHCWHSGMNALLPDMGSFVANVYSTTQGDLLISTGPASSIVHSFTAQKTLSKSP